MKTKLLKYEFEIDQARELIQIDVDDLDHCIGSQPECYYQIARARADAESEMDYVKEEYNRVVAAASLRLRKSLERQKEKYTESSINQHVTVDGEVKRTRDKYLQAKKDAALWTVMEESSKQRSFMLSKLSDIREMGLYTSGNIRSAKVSRNREVMDTDRKLRDRNKKRRRLHAQ